MRPPIFFVHGAFSHAGHLANWQALFSGAGFECYAPSLPGHAPSDRVLLASLTLDDYLAALKGDVVRFAVPPVIVGHSMGGLLAQQLASIIPCQALICVAAAPPWIVIPQMRALPFLLPMIPALLSGQAIQPSDAAFRNLVLHDLPEEEQHDLLPTFGAESGRAYRAMLLGLARLSGKPFGGPVLCLSGSADRMISIRTSTAIARYYGARHEIFNHGHYLIAPSLAQQIAGKAIAWLERNFVLA